MSPGAAHYLHQIRRRQPELRGEARSGYGIIGDIIIGLLGAFVGSYLLQALKISIHVGHPVLDKAVVAFIGAVILLFVVGFFRPRTFGERVSGWFRRW